MSAKPTIPTARLEEEPAASVIGRGVCRTLREMGYGTLTEFRLSNGRRADVMGLNRDSEFVMVEIKSSETDFRSDGKWPEYLVYCDRFYFAVAEDFPRAILPDHCGLIIADGFGAAIVRHAPETTMNAARRRAQILRFALTASGRLHDAIDPRLL
ncbi:MAG: MmcB family DNA repair protein [Alphaproteobacteria bacterium]|nr:MmcB family DNA repair protein [Alphaproteobacteria bacterium]